MSAGGRGEDGREGERPREHPEQDARQASEDGAEAGRHADARVTDGEGRVGRRRHAGRRVRGRTGQWSLSSITQITWNNINVECSHFQDVDRFPSGAFELRIPVSSAPFDYLYFCMKFQMLRNLENRLDKATLKSQEAEHIRRTYLQIRAKLEEEHHSFEQILDEMEQDTKK